MNKILQLFSCQIFGHDDEKIIGVCENLNCAQPYRRVCFQCLKSHQELDPYFNMQTIMSERRLQTIINEFKSKQEDAINQMLQSCQVQQHILILEMIEFLKVWKFKLSYQKDITQKLSMFYQQEFKKISVEDYLLGDQNSQGIFKYLKKIEDKIADLDNYHKNYLINLLNIKQQDNRSIIQMSNNNEMSTQEKLLEDILQNLSIHKEKQFQQVVQNMQQPQQKDNPQVEFWEFILKQGFELKTKNLQEQFQNLKYLDQLDKYQDLYLQAYSMYYSEAQNTQLIEQLNLINESIQLNHSYSKSHELKKLIESKIQIQNRNLFENVSVTTIEMANEEMEKGCGYFKNSQYLLAIQHFDLVIKFNPRSQQTYVIKGVSLQKLNRHEEAKTMFDVAISLQPNDIHTLKQKCIKIHQLSVISLQYLQKYEEALELLDYIIKQDTRNVFLFIIRGSVLNKLERYEEALQSYDQAMQIDPSVPQAYNNKGVLFDELQRYDQAIEMFDKCIKMNPSFQNAYYNKGISLIQLNRFTEALDMFDETLKLNPKNTQAQIKKRKCLIQLGRHQEADQTYKEYFKEELEAQNREDNQLQE